MAMFTASRAQIATYLLGVCPFSIAFLVFLNSSVSFVITDLIGESKGVGDAVGTLGFADELLALIACPLWGLLSDRVGVRTVCSVGYVIIGLALFTFVQAKNIYPQLLLGRLFFSLGAAAASTMVTAVLPTMSFADESSIIGPGSSISTQSNGHVHASSVASEATVTPTNYRSQAVASPVTGHPGHHQDSASKIAGFVGMATGCGALVALTVFLPLPARFQGAGIEPGQALQYSYYVVGVIALTLAIVCLLGLHGLRSETHKGLRFLLHYRLPNEGGQRRAGHISSTVGLLYQAFLAGFQRKDIFVGYLGGFVARASSVAISLFVPLLVNAAFLSSDLCQPTSGLDAPAGLPDIKRRCPRAYVVAAELTGVSQMVALVCAPIFGYWSSRLANKTIPLMLCAAAGMAGYPLFALRFDAHDDNRSARGVAFLAVCLIGISQIGAIVCSLGILSRGILAQQEEQEGRPHASDTAETETTPLLENSVTFQKTSLKLADLKGSIAGIYSFYGGAGILILTKAGGALFDTSTTAAPFYMMASFNGILLVATIVLAVGRRGSRMVLTG